MDNKELIEKFYRSFANGDAKGMKECYHKDILFQDAAFGTLKGERASKMWEMLLSQKTANLKVNFDNIEATGQSGKAKWVAEYLYGAKKRKVVNRVSANFKFKDGKIIEHIDTFDLYKWTKQALGAPGHLLGWTTFMKKKIQASTNRKLDGFMKN